MAFNDFLKKAKETAANAAASAANAANAAKAKMDEKKQQMDAQKAERERIRAEKQAQADQETQQMLEAMSAENGDLFQIDTKQLLSFTAEFYDIGQPHLLRLGVHLRRADRNSVARTGKAGVRTATAGCLKTSEIAGAKIGMGSETPIPI